MKAGKVGLKTFHWADFWGREQIAQKSSRRQINPKQRMLEVLLKPWHNSLFDPQ